MTHACKIQKKRRPRFLNAGGIVHSNRWICELKADVAALHWIDLLSRQLLVVHQYTSAPEAVHHFPLGGGGAVCGTWPYDTIYICFHIPHPLVGALKQPCYTQQMLLQANINRGITIIKGRTGWSCECLCIKCTQCVMYCKARQLLVRTCVRRCRASDMGWSGSSRALRDGQATMKPLTSFLCLG